jgi:hypothetical protein
MMLKWTARSISPITAGATESRGSFLRDSFTMPGMRMGQERRRCMVRYTTSAEGVLLQHGSLCRLYSVSGILLYGLVEQSTADMLQQPDSTASTTAASLQLWSSNPALSTNQCALCPTALSEESLLCEECHLAELIDIQ